MSSAKTKIKNLKDIRQTFPKMNSITKGVVKGLVNVTISNKFSRKSGKLAFNKNEAYKLHWDKSTYEVIIKSSLGLSDYRHITPTADWNLLLKWAKPMAGKSVVFINSTMEGGGVAMLRPPLVTLLRMLGIEAHWYVMSGRKNPDDPNPFIFTKQMHNISQRQAAPDERINEEGKSIHQKWNEENAEVLTLQPTIKTADIIFLDDPQPAPLKKYIEKVNPNAKWVWRNHIDTSNVLMSDPSTPQGEIASYVLDVCGIRSVNAVVCHPVKEFIHPGMYNKTFFAPATVDPLDDLNRPLNKWEARAGIAFINREISLKNREFVGSGRVADIQSKIHKSRRWIVLVARFDESKGIDKAMAIGVGTRQKMRQMGVPETHLPQVIILGNGSVDDPSGKLIFEKMLQIRRKQYPNDMKNIIIMRLRHNYRAINALMIQNLAVKKQQYHQVVALQTSDAEGCETRISD